MILALDSSAPWGSTALVENGNVIEERSFENSRGRGGQLFLNLNDLIQRAPFLSRIVCGTGPGSYNGIRSALATAWGMAEARGISLVGVSSLLGLEDGEYIAIGDARRGQYYFAEVDEGRFIQEPILFEKEELVEKLHTVLAVPILIPAPIEFLPEARICHPSAARLARLGALQVASSQLPKPCYLKEAYIHPGKA